MEKIISSRGRIIVMKTIEMENRIEIRIKLAIVVPVHKKSPITGNCSSFFENVENGCMHGWV